ncbi:hypothetical protein Pfo_023495 [Paulownia fortunei]|nr:hypothetical protein Pfo_023495 [Paulownia fortunei]
MKRNCNLELRLVTPSVFSHSSDHNAHYPSMVDMEGGNPNEKQQLTIFYNGRVAVCDATELQARAIIWFASREGDSPGSDPSPPLLTSSLYSPTAGLSMKRSLKRFLQKRKTRAQATSPYPVTRHSNED